ncbi:MAG: ABC transporter permease [Alphaproteobacteria bacterium]|nr:ABC transporter permease [Alphaproteobacteria bacterium]
MGRFIGVRLLHALVILALVTVLVFIIAQLMPGDGVLAAMAGSIDMSDASAVERVRKQYGLDQPILVQFGDWLARFVTGDWGTSIGGGEKVYDMFMRRLSPTLELFLGATIWSIGIGIPAGIIGALKRNSAVDVALTTGTMIGVSIPAFWEAIMLIYLLAVIFPILPPSGYVPFFEDPWLNIKSMLLPTFVLGTHSAGLLARYVRSSLLEVLGQDYIRTARAKGFSERAVIVLHALKPAMIPVVTVIGLAWAHMLGGAFFVEVIFAIPGLGRMSVDAIFQKDFPVMQATLIAVTLNVLLVNLLVDILYGYLDPRIRVRR